MTHVLHSHSKSGGLAFLRSQHAKCSQVAILAQAWKPNNDTLVDNDNTNNKKNDTLTMWTKDTSEDKDDT